LRESSEKEEAVPPTRRERLRDATLLEIKEAARRHLRAHGPTGISLRAIARDIGMTAPALYRYYSSLDDLVSAMIESFTDELSDTMEAARDELPADDIGGRLVTVTRTFRRWALDHRAEFTLVFGAPVPAFGTSPQTGFPAAGGRFAGIFFTLFTELWRRQPFAVPSDEEIPTRLRSQLRSFAASCGADDAGLPLGVIRMYAASWVKLYGLVTMEVFGHVQFLLHDAEALFEAELMDLGMAVGVKPKPAVP
jgi:AcrR family transcriptional regulator